jgi:hypothetical protein
MVNLPRARKNSPKIARMDAATPETQLFKVRPKNTPRLQAEECHHSIITNDGILDITYTTPFPLNDVDMRVFLAAVGLCSDEVETINKNATELVQKNLWDKFLTEGEATNKNGSTARSTLYALAQAAGMGWSASVSKRVESALHRMSHVKSTYQSGKRKTSGSNMLSYNVDLESGELALAVSPHFASAILNNAQRFIKVNLSEMRELKHPASVIIHMIMTSRLSLGTGKRKKRDLTISIDKLADAVYGEATSSVQRRQRRANLKPSFEELDKLGGWHVFYDIENGKVNFTRSADVTDIQLVRSAERIDRELKS